MLNENEQVVVDDELTSQLKSRMSNVKEKIINGKLSLDINPLQFELSIDNKLISQTMNKTHRPQSNIHFPKVDNYILVRKICIKNRSSNELLNPNEIIKLKRRQVQEKTQNDKKSIKIFRVSKCLFRSLSKEIDKRTKQQFGLIKKSFNFMQYDNPFRSCHKLNLNSNENNRGNRCFNLPFLKQNSLFLSKQSLDQNNNSNIDNNTANPLQLPDRISLNPDSSFDCINKKSFTIDDKINQSIIRRSEHQSSTIKELKKKGNLLKQLGYN